MTSTQKNQKLGIMRRSERIVQHNWLSTMSQLKTNNLKVLYELLCKPVSVTVTRLPQLVIEKHSKKILDKIRLKQRQKTRMLKLHKRKGNSAKEGRTLKKSRVPNVKTTEVSAPKSKATRKRKLPNSLEAEENVLRLVKQPRIQLQKIDKVFNKIARTFAKVISEKDKAANRTMQQLTDEIVTGTVIESVSSTRVPSVFSSNENKSVQNIETQTTIPVNCVKDLRVFSNDENKTALSNETQTSTFNSCGKNLPVFSIDESRSQQNNRVRMTPEFVPNLPENQETEDSSSDIFRMNSGRRRRRLRIISSDEESIEEQELNLRKEVTQISKGSADAYKTKDSMQTLTKRLDISEESYDLIDTLIDKSSIETATVMSDDEETEDCASTDVPSEIRLTLISKDVCSQENNRFARLKESVSKSNQIKEKVKDPPISEKQLIEKYKLFKSLKIVLIRLDAMKASVSNSYSAKEIEQLTNSYINVFPKSKFRETLPRFPSESSSSINQGNDRRDVEIITISNKLPSCSSDEVQETKKSRRSVSHSLKSLISQKKTVRNLCFSNIKNTGIPVNKQTAHLPTKNPEIKSCSELPSFTSREKTLRKLHHNENSKKTIINIPGNKVRVIKLRLKAVSSSSVKFGRTNASKCGTAALPASSSTKLKTANVAYKCIVCDLCFDSYSLLQQHLPTHRPRQSVPIDTPSASSDSVEEILEIVKQKVVSSNSETDESSQSKKSSKAASKSSNKKKQIVSKNASQSKRTFSFSKKRIKPPEPNNDVNKCDICSQIFPTKADLTAHIFLHTEKELQRAYKNSKEMKESEETDAHSSLEKPVSPAEEEKRTELSTVQSNPLENNSSVKETETNTANAKSTVLTEIVSKETQNVKEKDKAKALNKKKELIVCKCHNSSKINDNCLQIEIVLLCHTCRVLFRSLECFETHYRLPDSALCNQNRQQSGRSPNLFCTTCGMVLSSVFELRRHLEQHERFYQNLTKDLRCNICKVVFIGVGNIFYNHWSKHAKDAFWVASEQSFPKLSIVKPNIQAKCDALGKAPSYIFVAEHICYDCRTPFGSEAYLNKHKCSANKSANDRARKNQIHPRVRLVCNLCDGVYLERTEFYKHIREKHNFIAENEFVCVSLQTFERAFICTVCMDITENINDFEEHWVQHSTNQPRFGCSFCEKDFQTLNWFLEHVKEHNPTPKDGVLTSFVSYRKAKFCCSQCNTGFESQKAFTEHSIYHRVNLQMLQNRITNISGQGNPMSCKSSFAPILSKLKESIGEQNEKAPDLLERLALEKKGAKDLEKEKLINILEGTDSDHELTIDLTEPSKQNGTQEKDNDGRQVVSVLEESTTETPATPGNKTDSCTEKVTDESSQNSTSNIYQCENEQSLDNHNAEISSSANKEDLIMPKKNSPLKQGFLRVRKLAELIDTRLHACNSCGHETQETATPLQQTKSAASSEQMLPATQIPQKIITHATQSDVINRYPQSKQNFMSAYHKNLPACNIVQKSVVVPRSSVQRSEKVQAKTVMNSSNVSMSISEHPEVLSRTCSYQVDANENQKINCNGSNAQPVCRVQQGSEVRSIHDAVGNTTAATASNAKSQTCEQQAKNASIDFPQCLNVATNSRNNQTHQNQVQIGTPIYYSNATNGGMSIVINQTTSAMQSMPPGIMSRQGQQRMHQPFVYGNPVPHVDSYMQQPQNMNNYSGLNSGVYMMPSNPGEVPVGGALTTYEVMMQAAEGLVCPYCPNAVPFMSEELLQLHVDSAHNYECDMCSQRFYGLNDLSLHRIKHRFM